MKKRLLAMLLALMLVVGLLPVGVLADGDIWDGYGTFSYHISDSNLQAMVDAYNTTGASSGVKSVSITFNEAYTLGGQKTFLFRNGYTIGFSNTSTSVQPDDIDCLTITLIDGTVLTIPGDELDWTWVNTSPKRYDLRLKNSDKSTVTFYYQPNGSYTYDEYASVEVDSGTALNGRMPADPTELGDYKFVGWEIGSSNGDGREFHADTIVSENIAVYARMISVGGGAEVNVINLENSIYSNAYEHFNNESLEITGIALNGGGKSTNPNYDTTPGTGEGGTDTGWRDGNSYYYIYNVESYALPEGGNYWNDRVDPYNLDSITIFTTDSEYNIPRDKLDVRVKNDAKVEIYLREATEPETPVEPDPQPEPETNPDVSNVSVVVDCKTNDKHDRTVNIIEGSCTFNKAWDKEQWTCTVEITPNSYVTDDIHTLDPESQTGELLYVYADSSWQYVGGSAPTVTFTVECEGGEEPEPEPEDPSDPTEDELNQLAVVLDCINADVEHKNITFHLDQGNSFVTVDFTMGICTVQPNYDFILATYNEQVADGHTYADEVGSEKTFTLVWDGEAWDNGNAEPITRQVKCETPVEPDPYNTIHVSFVGPNGEAYGGGDVISTMPDGTVKIADPVAEGMEFVGWKKLVGLEEIYTGDFTYTALAALVGDNFTPDTHEAWLKFEAVFKETPVEPEPTPDPAITGFSKTLVKDRNLYVYQGLAYPTFYRGSVRVDEGDGVTLLYNITVKGTPGTEFTVRDDSADFAQTGVILPSGETSFYVAKTFTWREIRRAHELTNTAAVLLDGELADSDTETVDVHIDWDYNPPMVDDDDDDDEVFVPNWLNTTDHYAYIVGYEDGEVKPNNNITRAEVATIFYRLLTDSSRERWYTDSNSFTDVADDSWYNEPVSTLSRMGIINGYEDGSFKPNAPITRAEFTAIATRFFDYSARYDGAFYDVSAGSWYADYIQAAVDMGLVEGYPDGGVHPGSNITRAEAVTIVNRVLNRVPHEDHLLSTRVMNTWPDNKPGAWYYADMQEATNSHDYDWTRVNGQLVEDWTNKLADPNW